MGRSINNAHKDWICGLAFLPGDKTIVSGCRAGYIKLWSADSCMPVGEMKAHNSTINTIATNNAHVFTGSNDGSIGMWKIRNPENYDKSPDTSESSWRSHSLYRGQALSRSGDYSHLGGIKYFGPPSTSINSSPSRANPYNSNHRLSLSNHNSPVHRQRLHTAGQHSYQNYPIPRRPKSSHSVSMSSHIQQ